MSRPPARALPAQTASNGIGHGSAPSFSPGSTAADSRPLSPEKTRMHQGHLWSTIWLKVICFTRIKPSTWRSPAKSPHPMAYTFFQHMATKESHVSKPSTLAGKLFTSISAPLLPSPGLRMYATLDLYHFSIPHSYKIWPNCFNMTLVYILLACRCIARLPHQRSSNSCSLHFIVFIEHMIKLQPHVLLNKHMHPATRRHIILEHVICALATLSTCHLST